MFKKDDIILFDCPTKEQASSIIPEDDINELYVTVLYNHEAGGEPFYIYSSFDKPNRQKVYTNFSTYDKCSEEPPTQEISKCVNGDLEDLISSDDIIILEVDGNQLEIPANKATINSDGTLDVDPDFFDKLPQDIQDKIKGD